jgi:hypothetical protein
MDSDDSQDLKMFLYALPLHALPIITHIALRGPIPRLS